MAFDNRGDGFRTLSPTHEQLLPVIPSGGSVSSLTAPIDPSFDLSGNATNQELDGVLCENRKVPPRKCH